MTKTIYRTTVGTVLVLASLALVMGAFSAAHADCYGNCGNTPPTCSIWATNTSVQNGGSTTLHWTSGNASSANLETVGSVSVSGSHTLYNLTQSRSYKLSVYGYGGSSSGNCEVTIQVTGGYNSQYPYNYPPPYYQPSNQYPYNYGYNSAPSCTITLTPQGGYSQSWITMYGYPMQLSWSSSNAVSASISPDIGSVSTSGSRTVYVKGQIYSMSVYGPGGTAVCQTASYAPTYPYNYSNPFSTTYPTYQPQYPTTPAVKLSQIPYTGADFGFAGTLALWLSVVALAGAGAVALARRNGFTEKVTTLISR